jgi:SRSO17 transposase
MSLHEALKEGIKTITKETGFQMLVKMTYNFWNIADYFGTLTLSVIILPRLI